MTRCANLVKFSNKKVRKGKEQQASCQILSSPNLHICQVMQYSGLQFEISKETFLTMLLQNQAGKAKKYSFLDFVQYSGPHPPTPRV